MNSLHFWSRKILFVTRLLAKSCPILFVRNKQTNSCNGNPRETRSCQEFQERDSCDILATTYSSSDFLSVLMSKNGVFKCPERAWGRKVGKLFTAIQSKPNWGSVVVFEVRKSHKAVVPTFSRQDLVSSCQDFDSTWKSMFPRNIVATNLDNTWISCKILQSFCKSLQDTAFLAKILGKISMFLPKFLPRFARFEWMG